MPSNEIFIVDMAKNFDNITFDFSPEVHRFSCVLRDMILSKFNTIHWAKLSSEYKIFYKRFSVDTSTNPNLSQLVSLVKVNIYFLPQGMNDYDLINNFGVFLDSEFTSNDKCILLGVTMHNGEQFTYKMEELIEHEMMHAFQHYKNEGKTVDSRLLSSNFNSEGLDNRMIDLYTVIEESAYLFEENEVGANIQVMWHQLKRFRNPKECKKIVYYKRAIGQYEKMRWCYETDNGRNVAGTTNKEGYGASAKEISYVIEDLFSVTPSYYFKVVNSGVEKCKEAMDRMINNFNATNENMKPKITIHLTESKFNRLTKALSEDVLGNDWNVNDDDYNEALNNYEPFKKEDGDDGNEHNWSLKGDRNIDPTVYN